MDDRSSLLLTRVARSIQVDPDHPAVAYLASLQAPSRISMSRWLRVAAQFFGYTIRDCRWTELKHAHVLALRAWCAERYAPGTGNAILGGVRQVLRYAVRLGRMSHEAARMALDGVPRIKGDRVRAGRHLEAAELGALFGVCDDEGEGRAPRRARDAAALALLYAGGMRRSEVVGIDLEDVHVSAGLVVITRAKGNKQREVPIGDGAMAAIRDWIGVRGDEPGPLILPVRNGVIEMRRLSDSGLYRALLSLARRAKLQRFSPHDFRRTMIGDLLDGGADIKAIADIVGHESIETTAGYDRRPERAKRRAASLIRVPYRAARTAPADATPGSVAPAAG